MCRSENVVNIYFGEDDFLRWANGNLKWGCNVYFDSYDIIKRQGDSGINYEKSPMIDEKWCPNSSWKAEF